MRFEFKSFRTRVARRIFLLFFICALLPIVALSTVAYFEVSSQLETAHFDRLQYESKALATSIYERLLALKEEMGRMVLLARIAGDGSCPDAQDVMDGMAGGRFSTIVTEPVPADDVAAPPDFEMRIGAAAGRPQQVSLVQTLPKGDRRLVAAVNQRYLWEAGLRLPEGSAICILGREGELAVCTEDNLTAPVKTQLSSDHWRHKGTLRLSIGDRTYRAAYSSIFLESNFGAADWTVLLIEPESSAFSLMKEFAIVFPAMIIFALALVFFLGQHLIRRNMGPIETLQSATARIAEGQFGTQVTIDSSDEFEDLAKDFNEMSRRLKLGQQLLVRSARMATMGQMAAGFIHEVKQPLTAITGLVELVLLRETDDHNIQSLNTIQQAVDSLDITLTRFRSFSQNLPSETANISLNDTVEEVYRLFEVRFRKTGVDCRLELQTPLPAIRGDARNLQQVMSNLLINAMDAVDERSPDNPWITIQTQAVSEKIVLTVADNGCGIPEPNQDKVFDPFFTTKPPNKGTGLGMAIIESIVHQHGGDIELSSTVDKGTTVRVILDPAPEEEPE